MPDEILTPKQAAEFLKVPARTLESWRYRKTGPAFLKYGRSTARYRLVDLVAFLEKCRQENQGAAA